MNYNKNTVQGNISPEKFLEEFRPSELQLQMFARAVCREMIRQYREGKLDKNGKIIK
jgi:hypothetical protein